MIVAVDTNVIYQALYSSKGASHAILRLVRAGDLRLALSVPVFLEYSDVLRRPSTLYGLGLDVEEMQAVLDFLALAGLETKIHFLCRPNLGDEADNIFIFVELAFASGSEYLITSNIKDYTRKSDLKFDSFQVVTPGEYVHIWRESHEESHEK